MHTLSRHLFVLAVFALAAADARAQSFNIDIGDQLGSSPIPSSTYGAGASQPGTWNGASAAPPLPIALVDITGATTGVTLAQAGGNGAFDFDNTLTSGDDQALMDDCQDVSIPGTATTWTFANLAGGNYQLFTYAWAPDSSLARTSVSAGTIDPPQTCGGAWPGTQQLGVTYTLHHFAIATGSSIAVTINAVSGQGRVNGLQLVQLPPPGTNLCFGDGSGTPCPAGNNSQPGQNEGCLNSLGMGARIEAVGNPSLSADTLHLHGSGMTLGSCLYFQGSALVNGGAGAVFGDGLRCAGGVVVRLGIEFNGHGSSEYPSGSDLPVSVRGMVSTPGFKYYEVWYRDAAMFGTMANFNLSHTVCIPWVP